MKEYGGSGGERDSATGGEEVPQKVVAPGGEEITSEVTSGVSLHIFWTEDISMEIYKSSIGRIRCMKDSSGPEDGDVSVRVVAQLISHMSAKCLELGRCDSTIPKEHVEGMDRTELLLLGLKVEGSGWRGWGQISKWGLEEGRGGGCCRWGGGGANLRTVGWDREVIGKGGGVGGGGGACMRVIRVQDHPAGRASGITEILQARGNPLIPAGGVKRVTTCRIVTRLRGLKGVKADSTNRGGGWTRGGRRR